MKKGIKVRSVYDEMSFDGEFNDGVSQTITTGYIPINEQVKMIMRGEITIGSLNNGFEDADDDIEKEAPEEVFEDAVDIGSLYQDDVREVLDGALSAKDTSNTSEHQQANSKENDVSESETKADGMNVEEAE